LVYVLLNEAISASCPYMLYVCASYKEENRFFKPLPTYRKRTLLKPQNS